VTALLAIEVIGGLLVGLGVGTVGLLLLKGVDSYAVEILITLAMATGGYALAESLHTSAPIAVVMMGLLIGNQGRRFAMSERTRENLFSFWQLIDELLNLVLFGLIGLEFIALEPGAAALVPALAAIPIVLLGRWMSVGLPIVVIGRFRAFMPNTVAIMTWGGLRGGISVALALSLSADAGRATILPATYAVVIFSLLVQALTLPRVVRRLGA
jgi:CPA1 family monovalent cation:H+ antiporter